MTDITDNGDLIEGKPRESVTLRSIIDSINNIIQDDLIDAADDIEKQSSILTATGIWLDHIGKRLIYPRPKIAISEAIWFAFDDVGVGFDQAPFGPDGDIAVGIADESYRGLLIIRGGQLLTDGSIPSMTASIQGAFSSGNYIDNGDMTLDVILDSTLSDAVIVAIVNSGIITKPAGVRIRDTYIKDADGAFGFDGNGVGFDQGTFIRTFAELEEGSVPWVLDIYEPSLDLSNKLNTQYLHLIGV